ncbi:type II toxin-antitoxin system PemK/MazF family toxin [Cellulomonas chitinilytica]|uniref:type II toxin-antitoxin system PemK/MazF family toxin n=1 Tax=Cellulomonas chitinilytica TaxID=398759 RepID=UPI0035711528
MAVTSRVTSALRRLVGAVRPGRRAPSSAPPTPAAAPRALPDHRGPVRVEYTPSPDGVADPGEVVWTWVPYEDDPTRGKDRPVLVVGRDGGVLLGLMLTSKDHSRDAADEARWGRRWMDLGPGAWDRQGRPSEVRLDRVLRIDPHAVRREGAVLDRSVFDRVAHEVTAGRGAGGSRGRRSGW